MAANSLEACALVTGAARRLGRAIAEDLARAGWRVAVHYQRSEADARGLVAEIEAFGGRAAAVQADLSELQALPGLIEDSAKALGPVACLVNNAACFSWDWPDDFDETGWTQHHEVNLRAPVFLTKAFANALPAGVEGNVINLIDQKVHALNPHYFTYTIAKSALWTATRTLAQALAPQIRVNAIAPGPVLPFEGQSDEDFARECHDTLLKRPVPMSDITATVRFLLETGSITGQMIALDGGRHLNWRPDAG
ncbi:SDR family oxidoreductase [Methyloceanibacter caenitepidi]|uniref:FolM Alternative dihydrofolate reductase 1 n=1 Tax=Methyloceanibacter caenitepidi TaxID=1384459 RepID=A0A0A8K6E5_9HYPH|nr:SDR family oxidoreductase [Methyloceanibacter caenitepidi]BAQ18112.1 FolM Alternative dihydrofolate reductase 1 [Methyloceanibacter caenitepidi]